MNNTLASSVRTVDAGNDLFQMEVYMNETEETLKLTEMGINTTTHNYWTNGTFKHDWLGGLWGYVCISSSGEVSGTSLKEYAEYEQEVYITGPKTLHLRPIFTLLDTVNVVSGDGESVDTAYKLSAQ